MDKSTSAPPVLIIFLHSFQARSLLKILPTLPATWQSVVLKNPSACITNTLLTSLLIKKGARCSIVMFMFCIYTYWENVAKICISEPGKKTKARAKKERVKSLLIFGLQVGFAGYIYFISVLRGSVVRVWVLCVYTCGCSWLCLCLPSPGETHSWLTCSSTCAHQWPMP